MPESRHPDIERLLGSVDPDKKDEQVAILEDALVREIDARKEERFFFSVAIVILLDFMWFSDMQTWGAPIAILVLQIILLFGLARRWGIDYAARLIDRLASSTRDRV